jgi:hypothetical protein
LTEEKLDDISTQLEAEAIMPLACQCDLAESTALVGTKVAKVAALQNLS